MVLRRHGATTWKQLGPDVTQNEFDLLAALSDTGRPSLLHGDFWPGNVLWANAQLVAVIDREGAALGSAASDVACCRAELNAMFDERAVHLFTDSYRAASADDLADLALWDIYVGSAALATLHQWGLPSEVETLRRARTSTFVAHAAEALLRGSSARPR